MRYTGSKLCICFRLCFSRPFYLNHLRISLKAQSNTAIFRMLVYMVYSFCHAFRYFNICPSGPLSRTMSDIDDCSDDFQVVYKKESGGSSTESALSDEETTSHCTTRGVPFPNFQQRHVKPLAQMPRNPLPHVISKLQPLVPTVVS